MVVFVKPRNQTKCGMVVWSPHDTTKVLLKKLNKNAEMPESIGKVPFFLLCVASHNAHLMAAGWMVAKGWRYRMP